MVVGGSTPQYVRLDEEAMSIEKSYDSLCQEMCAKVEQAAELLREAKELATKAGIYPLDYDDWTELREIIGNFIEVNKVAWETSSWCTVPPDGWNSSGCTF
jgi:hypothetical protein